MFSKINDWFWSFFSRRAVSVAGKFVLAWLSSKPVSDFMQAHGITIDPVMLQATIASVIMWIIERVHHLYDKYMEKKSEK